MATSVERVVAFGDSFLKGTGATNHYGWLQRLEHRFYDLNGERHMGCPFIAFYNQGIVGARVTDVNDSVAQELPRRTLADDTYIAPDKVLSIVAFGLNDAWRRSTDGLPKTPKEEFAERVGHIAEKLAQSSKILYVGPTIVNETANRAFYGLPTAPQRESIREYEAVACESFRDVGATVVPMVEASEKEPHFMDWIHEDGVHFDDRGYRWLYERIVPHFDELVGVEQGHAVH